MLCPRVLVKVFSIFVSPKSNISFPVIGHRPAHISVSTPAVVLSDQADRYALITTIKFHKHLTYFVYILNVNVVRLECDFLILEASCDVFLAFGLLESEPRVDGNVF